jgi:suppressor of ftsI
MMSTNGQPHETHDLQDVTNVPTKGQVVIRMQFTNYTAKTVLHCYILNHEVGA